MLRFRQKYNYNKYKEDIFRNISVLSIYYVIKEYITLPFFNKWQEYTSVTLK